MYLKLKYGLLLILALFLSSCRSSDQKRNNNASDSLQEVKEPTNQVLLQSEIVWEKLNPARGEQSPLAGTIWGDRKGNEATGFLAKFVDGFSSPPHIHNVTYRAVVIKGAIHNDDPKAEKMWMKPGSFWTQPKGESHITAAKGKENIALVEIDKGPYLVKPVKESFDNGERPINIEAANIVWLGSKETNWIAQESKAELSFLWEDKESKGLFIKLPMSFDGSIETDGTVMHGVVISGKLNYILPNEQDTKTLDPGSSFSSSAEAIHSVSSLDSEVLLYLRTNGDIKIHEK